MKNLKAIQRMIEAAFCESAELEWRQMKIAICPFGENGFTTKEVLNKCYGIDEVAIIDNKWSKWNPKIISVADLEKVNAEDWIILLNSTIESVNCELENQIKMVLPKAKIINIIEEPVVVENSEKQKFYSLLKEKLKTRNVLNHELIRVGKLNDGGYILLNDFTTAVHAYSFGIGSDVSWELDMVNNGVMDVFMYDPTICKLPQYHRGFHFSQIGISGKDSIDNKYLSMKSILKRNNDLDNKNLILKMDVEGAEWDFILNTEEEILDNFIQMSFEFHNLISEENEDIVLKTFDKLNHTHCPIWVHANNSGINVKIGSNILPGLLEVTFVNKKLYEFGNKTIHYPISLDSPNIRTRREIELGIW